MRLFKATANNGDAAQTKQPRTATSKSCDEANVAPHVGTGVGSADVAQPMGRPPAHIAGRSGVGDAD